MLVQNIVAGVNTKLAGETLTYTQMRLFLDEVIDDINSALSANFPTFEDIPSNGGYTAFPDKYIRSVIITGVAAKFYVTDEEGIETASQYSMDYRERLFIMKRDHSMNVPEEYQDYERGSLVGAPTNGGNQPWTFGGW